MPTAIPILTLTDWNMRGIALSLSPGVLLCVLYAAIVYSTPIESHQSNQLVNIDAIADSLSRRVAAILFIALGVQAIVFSSYSYNPTHVLLLALFKGLSWYFLLLLVLATSYNDSSRDILTCLLDSTCPVGHCYRYKNFYYYIHS